MNKLCIGRKVIKVLVSTAIVCILTQALPAISCASSPRENLLVPQPTEIPAAIFCLLVFLLSYAVVMTDLPPVMVPLFKLVPAPPQPIRSPDFAESKKRHKAFAKCLIFLGGATGDRTPDLMTARFKKDNAFVIT